MNIRLWKSLALLTLVALAARGASTLEGSKTMDTNKVTRSEAEWRAQLTPEQYRVLRQQGTERAFTGKYWNHFQDGTYRCAGCEAVLFTSASKFESHCGWPSFDRSADTNVVEFIDDRSHGMVRTEVRCRRCGGHLGHIFDDGPTATGQRYCINSASITFTKKAETPAKSPPPAPTP